MIMIMIMIMIIIISTEGNRKEKQVQRPRTRNTENVAYENNSDPCSCWCAWNSKKGMIENIEKVSKRANVTEIQKICMLGSARILRKVLSI